jgi:hypothetical protein
VTPKFRVAPKFRAVPKLRPAPKFRAGHHRGAEREGWAPALGHLARRWLPAACQTDTALHTFARLCCRPRACWASVARPRARLTEFCQERRARRPLASKLLHPQQRNLWGKANELGAAFSRGLDADAD